VKLTDLMGALGAPVITDPEELPEDTGTWCVWPENDYLIRRFDDHRYVAIAPFIYTVGIIRGDLTDKAGYSDRWCYKNVQEALVHATIWTPDQAEPMGWHRSPTTGRRRPDGDESKEYTSW
jgi:hypothetical protein